MTIEEKAKAYDELKVKAQKLEEDGCFDKITLFDLFSELKESEDERIINRIIHALHGDVLEMSEIKEAIDWLNSLKDRYTWKPSDDQM